MSGNTFGRHFCVHSFGESHGSALGAVIDGCPAGLSFDLSLLQKELQRRRPGYHGKESDSVQSQRKEGDEPEILSGVFEGKTLGTPIAIIVRNQDARSEDYNVIKSSPRMGHADDVWFEKYGHSDYRGGGRSSGRETVARVLGGTVGKMLIRAVSPRTQVWGCSLKVGPFSLTESEIEIFLSESEKNAENFSDNFIGRFPSPRTSEVQKMLLQAQQEGESHGGTVLLVIKNPPRGLGQPVFHKLKADLAAGMMSVGATTAFELGDGIAATERKGTEFHSQAQSSKYGGIRGGISTGEDILLKVHFKPTSSIMDTAKKGRHDPCIVPRAVPVLESMAYLVLADHWLSHRTDRV